MLTMFLMCIGIMTKFSGSFPYFQYKRHSSVFISFQMFDFFFNPDFYITQYLILTLLKISNYFNAQFEIFTTFTLAINII